MLEVIQLLFPFLALFLVSTGLSYLLMTAIKNTKRLPTPNIDGKVRIRATSGVYRSRFLGETDKGWTFSAPICRDAYVPLRVGEDLTIEAADEEGVLRFRTTVVARDADEHVFTMSKPKDVFRTNRREEERRKDLRGQIGELEGSEASVLDVSTHGICLVSDKKLTPGDRVKVAVPWSTKPTFGWVLGREGHDRFCKIRIRFDDAVALPKAA